MSSVLFAVKSGIVLAGHRIHDEDVYSHIAEKYKDGKDWVYLVLPAEADPDFTNTFHNPHWKDPRKPGELLWPNVVGEDKLKEFKRQLRNDYYTVFQQRPAPQEGALFKGEWFKTCVETPTSFKVATDP